MLAITRSPTSFLSPWCTSWSWSSIEVETCCSCLFVSGVSCGECWIPLQIPVESAFVLVCRAGVFVFWFAQACPAELELVLFLRLGCASPSSRCPGYLPFVTSTTVLQAIHSPRQLRVLLKQWNKIRKKSKGYTYLPTGKRPKMKKQERLTCDKSKREIEKKEY
jgi:hypothetical protein